MRMKEYKQVKVKFYNVITKKQFKKSRHTWTRLNVECKILLGNPDILASIIEMI